MVWPTNSGKIVEERDQVLTTVFYDPEPEQPSGTKVRIVCSGGTVNIRVGNGTDYGRISAVTDGTEFEYVATAANGWHAVKIGSQVGWVSGEYSEITTE